MNFGIDFSSLPAQLTVHRPVLAQALTDSFCNSTGTTCVDTATGFGTVGVSDNYGSGGNLTYAWNTCVDEHHWSGTAATDPCSS